MMALKRETRQVPESCSELGVFSIPEFHQMQEASVRDFSWLC